MRFSGKVLYANRIPAQNVHVKVFDKDEPGKVDDDLTTSEGVSNENGEFVVSYKRSRYLDTTESEVPAPDHPLAFAFSTTAPPGDIPDLTDEYRPYLEFRYDHRGQPRRHTVSMMRPVREFVLPEALVPAEPFVPSRHGFKFDNSFSGYPLPFSIPELPFLPPVRATYGLCGGMSSAACDLYLYDRSVPSRTTPPGKRSALYQYLYRRQMDTFAMGRIVVKFYAWMLRPDDTIHGTQKLTYDEFEQIRAQLDDDMPVVLGLVYVSLRDTVAMWVNHQVLAYAYELVPPAMTRIKIYDPNWSGKDDITIEAERVSVGREWSPANPQGQAVYGLKCVQRFGSGGTRDVRGFFMMPYVPILPPGRMR